MFQKFDIQTTPETGPERLAALRGAMADTGVDGFLVPRADAHQGETVPPCDERLRWLTSFTGSAGMAVATAGRAAIFVDGRYTLQAREQVSDAFDKRGHGDAALAAWLIEALPEGGTVGFDPWLHATAQIERLEAALSPAGIMLKPIANLVDAVWSDRPDAPAAPMVLQPEALAGASAEEKREAIAADLRQRGSRAALITLPDSIAWLLNVRGGDIARMPVALGFAIVHDDATVETFGFIDKAGDDIRAALGNAVSFSPRDAFLPAIGGLSGTVSLDRATAPIAVVEALRAAGATPDWHEPIALPKARKTAAEIAGARSAHLRDGIAMARFLAWLDREAPGGGLTEIDVCRRLEAFRAETGEMRDISFETICGAGPNGAIVHYRVNEASNRAVRPGELLLVDSGAQYRDGTTDITRTLAVGDAGEDERRAFTLVLKGMIAISRARWPAGLSGRDLDPLARIALWREGFDYAHGTGHGIGSYLGVHEGPQRIARISEVPLEPGMMLSNEPGYYREGAFGIRIENLVVVTEAETPQGGDLPMLGFETLTLAPIDRRLVATHLLDPEERGWLNAYHARVHGAVGPHLDDGTRRWLQDACAPI
ncbi:MAG: aminopeptidase P family protein [Rubricella sp.]